MNDYNGTLVAAEGIDGAGTTTLVENLSDRFPDAIITKEPSEQFYGQAIRSRLEESNEPTPADFYGFLADRYQHCENVIRPALEEGKIVITDRYDWSTYAYQSKVIDEQLGIIDPMKYIDEMSYHFTIEPDLYLVICIGVDEALDRIDAEEKYEKRERLEEALRIYTSLAEENENAATIPGYWSEDFIADEAGAKIQKLLR